MLALLPEGATWIIPLTFILLLMGWISSIMIAAKQKGLVLLAFIPLTNPLAVVAMLFKHTSTGLIPFAAYALALATWLYGSHYSHKVEFERLSKYENMLKDQGEPLRASAYSEHTSNPDNNVWDHPYLMPLSLACQRTVEGEEARKTMDQLYENWSLPKHSVHIRYDDPNENRLPFITPDRTIHAVSAGFLQSSGSQEIKWPKSPKESADALEPFFDENRLEEVEKLREAVNRPEDVYPHAWEDGFDMLLPQLAKLKRFSQMVSLGSIFHSIQGNQRDSYQYARLAFQLSETGDSDLLISRLVQIAQIHIALETIMAAQQAHLWTDEQWVQIRSILDGYNMIQLIPNSLRLERAMGYTTIEPMFNQSWSSAMKHMNQMGTGGNSEIEKGALINVLDTMASKFSQAFLAKQWRMCLEAYSYMIEDLEQGMEASSKTPWKDIKSTWSDENIHQYGIFAKMLLPALSKVHHKAFLIQLKIELAKAAIDLERYYLKHGRYPNTIEDLSPAFSANPPIDPMTHLTLAYKKLDEDGFEIYSVGMDGKDDKGTNIKSSKRNQPAPPDDLLWSVRQNESVLPVFHMDE